MDKSRRQRSKRFASDVAYYLAGNESTVVHVLLAPKASNDAPTLRCPVIDPRSSRIENVEFHLHKYSTVIRTDYSNYMVCADQHWVTVDRSGRHDL